MDVRAQIGRSTGRSTPQVLVSSGQEWQFYIYTVRVHIGRSTGRSTPKYWHLVVKNGNLRFLLLEFILEDQLADLPSKYWHLVVKNGNLRFLLLDSYWKINWQIYPPPKCNVSWDVYYGMYLTGIVDSLRKGESLLLFLNNWGSNQSVSTVESYQI